MEISKIAKSLTNLVRQNCSGSNELLTIIDQKNENMVIQLEEEGGANICCQHVIDFWENYLTLELRDHPEFTIAMEKSIQWALKDNCKSYIDPLRSSSKPHYRSISEQFDKCMKGDDFDFVAAYETAQREYDEENR